MVFFAHLFEKILSKWAKKKYLRPNPEIPKHKNRCQNCKVEGLSSPPLSHNLRLINLEFWKFDSSDLFYQQR